MLNPSRIILRRNFPLGVLGIDEVTIIPPRNCLKGATFPVMGKTYDNIVKCKWNLAADTEQIE